MHAKTHDDLAIALSGLCRQDLSLFFSSPLWVAIVCLEWTDAPFGNDFGIFGFHVASSTLEYDAIATYSQESTNVQTNLLRMENGRAPVLAKTCTVI